MPYSERSREACFLAWYAAGRPGSVVFSRTFRDAESGRQIDHATIAAWINHYNWNARADAMDSQATSDAENNLVAERRDMFIRHRQIGQLAQRKGVAFLRDHELTSGHEAIRSLEFGIAAERGSLGVPDMLTILQMSDEQLLDLNRTLSDSLAGREGAEEFDPEGGVS